MTRDDVQPRPFGWRQFGGTADLRIAIHDNRPVSVSMPISRKVDAELFLVIYRKAFAMLVGNVRREAVCGFAMPVRIILAPGARLR